MPFKNCRLTFVLPVGAAGEDEARMTLAIDLPSGPGIQEKLLPVFNSICRAAVVTLGSRIEGPFNVEQSESFGIAEQALIDSPNEWPGFAVPE